MKGELAMPTRPSPYTTRMDDIISDVIEYYGSDVYTLADQIADAALNLTDTLTNTSWWRTFNHDYIRRTKIIEFAWRLLYAWITDEGTGFYTTVDSFLSRFGIYTNT